LVVGFNKMHDDPDYISHKLTVEEAELALEQDWRRDSRGDGDVDASDLRRSVLELAVTCCLPMDERHPAPDYLAFLQELRALVFPAGNAEQQRDDFVLASKQTWMDDSKFTTWAHANGESTQDECDSFLSRLKDGSQASTRLLLGLVKKFMPLMSGRKKNQQGVWTSLLHSERPTADRAGAGGYGGFGAGRGARDRAGVGAGDYSQDCAQQLGGQWAGRSGKWTSIARFSALPAFFQGQRSHFSKLLESAAGDPEEPEEPEESEEPEEVPARPVRRETRSGGIYTLDEGGEGGEEEEEEEEEGSGGREEGKEPAVDEGDEQPILLAQSWAAAEVSADWLAAWEDAEADPSSGEQHAFRYCTLYTIHYALYSLSCVH
jgi:hypothetical protein